MYIMLSNIDLFQLAEYYQLPIIDITMKNELKGKPKDGAYIINLQSSTAGNGTHWTMAMVNKKEACYFDSFGVLPSEEVEDFIKKRKGIHLYYNHFDIQDLKSDLCGWFCLACIIFINKNMKNEDIYNAFNRFINGFSCNTKKNDSILKSFFSSEIGVGVKPQVLLKFLKSK